MFYNQEIDQLMKQLGANEHGLKASEVTENREKFGANQLNEKKRKGLTRIFLEQFKDLLVVILILAAIISLATGNEESAIVILAVLILNAILGTVQYIKAEKSLDSLKKLSAPTAKVIRDGQTVEIAASDIVVGDIALLEAGDMVPADGRIIHNYSLRVNESALTGESEAVEKTEEVIPEENVALGDQKNMVFSGSQVTYGRATVLIVAVGSDSQLGKIAELMNQVQDKTTPLQETMNNFSKKLSIGIIAICAVVFALNVYRGMDLSESLLFAVALAVAAIPEALSSIITISLAIGTSRMAHENAIIKELNAVEGLGCVSIICSDKTGTLTQNKMTVEDLFYLKEENLRAMRVASILCNDTKEIDGQLVGDPTETALVASYKTAYDDYYQVMENYPRSGELAFDSDRKLMTTLHYIDGKAVLFTKGALDVILDRCNSLTEEEKKLIMDKNFQWSNEGLRVLGFASKVMEDDELTFEDEYDVEFLGIMAEMDPPREESAQAVKECIEAGIKPIMITGDHKITASAIARKIGIMKDGDLALTGVELDNLSEDELMEKLEEISVYARVSPSNKIRIVQAWQKKGNIVAMTGDGVNDAPALKNADVGVAMGITGTEVSKDAASMILTDDNFATIVKSVLNGRNIYANIKNAIKFLLSGNTAGILVVLYTALMALPTPFSAVHLLFINLVTDSLPALAISMEPVNEALIHDKPRPRNQSILDKRTVTQILVQGSLIGAATIVSFYIGLYGGGVDVAMTMAFACLCLGRLWHGFTCRGEVSIFKLGLFTNMYTIGAFLLGALLLATVMMVPALMVAFTNAPLTLTEVFIVIGLSFAPTFVIQCVRGIGSLRKG